jgi:ATP-dependent Clp protease ATP-binding subunit ClpC
VIATREGVGEAVLPGLIRRAVEEATALGHEYIGAEHLLLAIAGEAEGTATRVLTAAGVEAEQVRAVMARWMPPEPNRFVPSPLDLSPRAQQALELAAAWVRRLRPRRPRREHLLLGILQLRHGIVPWLLEELGTRPEPLRAALLRERSCRA